MAPAAAPTPVPISAPFPALPVPAPIAAPLPAPTAAPVSVPQPTITIVSKDSPAMILIRRVLIIVLSSFSTHARRCRTLIRCPLATALCAGALGAAEVGNDGIGF